MYYRSPEKNLELATLKRDLHMAAKRTKSGRVRKRRRKTAHTSKVICLCNYMIDIDYLINPTKTPNLPRCLYIPLKLFYRCLGTERKDDAGERKGDVDAENNCEH